MMLHSQFQMNLLLLGRNLRQPQMLANIKMGIPSRSLVLFEINALVTAEIKRNGQIVHCLAKIQDTIETGNPQAVVTLHKMPFLIPIINQAPDK